MLTVSAFLAGFRVSAPQASPLKLTEASNNYPTLTMCIDHYPPLQIVLENGNATGRNVELTKLFFSKLGYQLRFTADIPFKRCLQWLKEGEIDVMTGLLGSKQRHTDFHMFLYDDHTVKSFFVRGDKIKIRQFSDLKGLNISVVRGTSQFETFDNAPENMFQKTYVNTLPAAFGMLALGRVDAVVCTDYYGDNVIKSHPDFQGKLIKAEYQEINGTKVYIALSRKSKFAFEAQRFNDLALKMFLSGEFKEMLRKYQSTHPKEF